MSMPEDLKAIAELLPSGQPVHLAIYAKDDADLIVESQGLSGKLNSEQWARVFDLFGQESENLFLQIANLFEKLVIREIDIRPEK